MNMQHFVFHFIIYFIASTFLFTIMIHLGCTNVRRLIYDCILAYNLIDLMNRELMMHKYYDRNIQSLPSIEYETCETSKSTFAAISQNNW